MHRKALIIDDEVAFTGGANATGQSQRNDELVLKVGGPIVHDIRRKVWAVKKRTVKLSRETV